MSYTGNETSGDTVGHGLGTAPSMIIFKNRDTVQDWIVYHASLGATKYLKLNATNAETTASNFFDDTAPTSSVFSVSTANSVNNTGEDLIAYCFAEKKGYSKFGSYTGNGNADGTFIYTGFKPAFLITKRTDSSSSGDWNIADSTRNPNNVIGQILYTNLSNAEVVVQFMIFILMVLKLEKVVLVQMLVVQHIYLHGICRATISRN